MKELFLAKAMKMTKKQLVKYIQMGEDSTTALKICYGVEKKDGMWIETTTNTSYVGY